jgi:flavin reductase (DIM6/NTAB) family NADH-FMN oxidoreductase RutF
LKIDSMALRGALGQFATGVCLVSARGRDGLPFALTVNSFAAVSLDPPLVLWSVQRSSEVFEDVVGADRYAINVLRAPQRELSQYYARTGNHHLLPAHWEDSERAIPVVPDCLANFECRLANAIDGGDHVILLGEVIALHRGEAGAPLLFFGGNYAQLA